MKHIFKSILDPIVFAVATLTLLFFGCTKKVYMPTETVIESRIETADTFQLTQVSKLIDQLQKSVRTQEKVVVRDSVIYVVNDRGETVSKEVYRDKDRDYSESETLQRVTQVYDSLFQRQTARIDSIISAFHQEPVIVEKEPSLWQRIKDGLVGASILAVFVGIFLLYCKIKSKNNY